MGSKRSILDWVMVRARIERAWLSVWYRCATTPWWRRLGRRSSMRLVKKQTQSDVLMAPEYHESMFSLGTRKQNGRKRRKRHSCSISSSWSKDVHTFPSTPSARTMSLPWLKGGKNGQSTRIKLKLATLARVTWWLMVLGIIIWWELKSPQKLNRSLIC